MKRKDYLRYAAQSEEFSKSRSGNRGKGEGSTMKIDNTNPRMSTRNSVYPIGGAELSCCEPQQGPARAPPLPENELWIPAQGPLW